MDGSGTATLVAAEGVTAAFNAEAVERLALRGPDWLAELRREAWATYERTPLPTTALEEWRYTEVSQLSLDAYRLPDEAPSADATAAGSALLDGRAAAGRVVIVDGVVVEVGLDPALAARGVVLSDLATAVETHGELVRQYLGREVTPAFSKFAEPRPLQLVRDGGILEGNMRREMLTHDELMSKLREQGVEQVKEVRWAFMESDGQISVRRFKDDDRPQQGSRSGAPVAG